MQAVAGTGDFSNLEQAECYVEALRRSAEDTAPARLAFGPRTIGYTLFPNLSGNGWGEPDDRGAGRARAQPNEDFRIGVSQAIDRQRLGESLVKGPFIAKYPGGLYAGTASTTRPRRSTIPTASTARRRISGGGARGHRRRRRR